MDNLSHGGTLQFVETLPDRAQPLPVEVPDNDGGQIRFPRGQFFPGQRGQPLQILRARMLGERGLESGDIAVDVVSHSAVSLAS